MDGNMSRRDVLMDLSECEVVPAWKAIDRLGYKATLYLASEDHQEGVVVLTYPMRPELVGIAWWKGSWTDPVQLRSNIRWSRSHMRLLAWASAHPVASKFDMLIHLLQSEVKRTAN